MSVVESGNCQSTRQQGEKCEIETGHVDCFFVAVGIDFQVAA